MNPTASLRSALHTSDRQSETVPEVPRAYAALGLLFAGATRLTMGTARLALLAVTPITSTVLVALGLLGLGTTLLFGGLLHVAHFPTRLMLFFSALCFVLVALLFKAIDLLRPR